MYYLNPSVYMKETFIPKLNQVANLIILVNSQYKFQFEYVCACAQACTHCASIKLSFQFRGGAVGIYLGIKNIWRIWPEYFKNIGMIRKKVTKDQYDTKQLPEIQRIGKVSLVNLPQASKENNFVIC